MSKTLKLLNTIIDILNDDLEEIFGTTFIDYGPIAKSTKFIIPETLFNALKIDCFRLDKNNNYTIIERRFILESLHLLYTLLDIFANRPIQTSGDIIKTCLKEYITCSVPNQDLIQFCRDGATITLPKDHILSDNVLFTRLLLKYCAFYDLPTFLHIENDICKYSRKYKFLGQLIQNRGCEEPEVVIIKYFKSIQ